MRPMTPLYIVTALAFVGEVICIQLHHRPEAYAVAIVFFVLTGFGVAIPQLRYFGPFICRGRSQGKQVALTFDDGPDPRSTPRLLDILREAKIPAAFFCIGKNVAAYPELAARIVREGHLLENHTYHHSNFTNFFSVNRLQQEMINTRDAIRKSSGAVAAYFRPPMGLSNPRTFRAARLERLQVVGWSIRSLDTITREPGKIVARIRRKLHGGAIVLLHDGNIPVEKLEATVKSLLDTLNQTGYEVVRLDKLLK